jgi:NADH-quinone oxidoreductase subunit D
MLTKEIEVQTSSAAQMTHLVAHRPDPLGNSQMTLSMGPQHPSTHGVLRLELVLDGETIVKATPDIGYLHTGIEKTMEKEKWQQVVTITCRADYLNSMGNDLGYVLAVEKLLGVEVPERAETLRVLFTELNRISSHLVWFGTHALDMGGMTAFFYAFVHREKILDLYECASGARLHQSYFRIGGLQSDIPGNFIPLLREFVDGFPTLLKQMHTLVSGNKIFQRRTKNVGYIAAADAIELGMTGPSLRGSGVAWDIRRTEPYTGYDKYDFDIAVEQGGDVWARYCVRMKEMEESLKIIRQCIDRLKPGPVNSDHPKLKLPERDLMKQHIDVMIHHFLVASEGFTVPIGEVYTAIESARGELGYYVISDGKERPLRVRMKTPSFANLQALPKMAEGQLLADVIAIIGSIDIVLGDVDR